MRSRTWHRIVQGIAADAPNSRRTRLGGLYGEDVAGHDVFAGDPGRAARPHTGAGINAEEALGICQRATARDASASISLGRHARRARSGKGDSGVGYAPFQT